MFISLTPRLNAILGRYTWSFPIKTLRHSRAGWKVRTKQRGRMSFFQRREVGSYMRKHCINLDCQLTLRLSSLQPKRFQQMRAAFRIKNLKTCRYHYAFKDFLYKEKARLNKLFLRQAEGRVAIGIARISRRICRWRVITSQMMEYQGSLQSLTDLTVIFSMDKLFAGLLYGCVVAKIIS